MTEKTRSNLCAGAYRNGVMVAMYVLTAMLTVPVYGQSLDRVNVGPGGVEADKSSKRPMVSGDGAFVGFSSNATNLVSGDTGLFRDVFLVERATGAVTRVSLGRNGIQADGGSGRPTISADGRYTAFRSDATNLVLNDSNLKRDIFLYDRVAGTTTLVSISGGAFPRHGDGSSDRPAISGNGQFIAYRTKATNLVTGDSNGMFDILVFDRVSGTTTRVSVDSSGAQAIGGNSDRPAISSDGRYVVFSSKATNLVAGDTNGVEDIFLHDQTTGETTRVSVASDGTAANNESSRPAISGDGRFITFTSSASNLVSGDTNGTDDVFLYERATGVTTRISVAADGTQSDGPSSVSILSADGSFISFRSVATNLVAGTANGLEQVYIVNRMTGSILLVSANDAGRPGSNLPPVCVPLIPCNPKESSSRPSLSADGMLVVFHSIATDLISGDTNDKRDIFLRDISGLDPDGDGFFDADDNCPATANADQADADGNGVGDACDDRDGDGTLDSVDGCPDDAAKTDPGVCGCGVEDKLVNGTVDCGQGTGPQDTCPNDPNKLSPGVCGCGVPDTDTDQDGVMDCLDNCPNDPNKQSPGICGCGVEDKLVNGTVDCGQDTCPNDPNKQSPGVCGCGVADTDTDQDGVMDCVDNCVNDANPNQVDTNGNGNGDACDPDDDSDGIPDAVDNCPLIANHNQADADGDGIGTVCDPSEVAPGNSGGDTTGGGNGTNGNGTDTTGTGGTGTDGSGTGGNADTPPDVPPGAGVPATDPGTSGSSTTQTRSVCGSFGMITFPMMFLGLCLIGRTPRCRQMDQS